MTKTIDQEFQGTTKEAINTIKSDIAGIYALFDKQDKRISNLERWRWVLTGGIMVLGVQMGPTLFNLIANAR